MNTQGNVKRVKKYYKENKMDANKEFSTKEMYLAVSLLYEGVKYLRIEPDENDPSKKWFIFEKDPKIEGIEAERANGTFVVSAIQYENSIRSIKSLIHSR